MIFLNESKSEKSTTRYECSCELFDGKDWTKKWLMETLYKYISKGGVIMLDDYSVIEGETKAVNEFFKKIKTKKIIHKAEYSKTPFYIVKK